jgi:hypothetical protein
MGQAPPMPSLAFQSWQTTRAVLLDEIESAHRSVGGTGPGRRTATQQLNFAYAVLLSSHFQGFCRDLHTECADFLSRVITPAPLQATIQAEWYRNRKLDQGNPNPGNIGADFNRFGVVLWRSVQAVDVRNVQRQRLLEALNEWRNAIAHQAFDPAKLGGTTTLQLATVRAWRTACNGLAHSFDAVMHDFIRVNVGASPW